MLALEAVLLCAALCGDGDKNAPAPIARGSLTLVPADAGKKCSCPCCDRTKAATVRVARGDGEHERRIVLSTREGGTQRARVQVMLEGPDGEQRTLTLPDGAGAHAFTLEGNELKPLEGTWRLSGAGKLGAGKAKVRQDPNQSPRSVMVEVEKPSVSVKLARPFAVPLRRAFKLEKLEDGVDVLKLTPGDRKVKVKRVHKSESVLI
ncbi:MAG: hypothetical protein U1E76_09640 [Planctomycetota bacterium]